MSDWVLGQQLDVWQAVFEASFLQRGKALIAVAFSQVRSTWTHWQMCNRSRQAASCEAVIRYMQCVLC